MKLLKIYLIIFCSFCLFSEFKAQDTTDIKSNIIKNGVGISFSPLFSKPLDFPSGFKNIKGKIGWSLGVTNILIFSRKHHIFLLNEIGYLQNRFVNEDIPNTANIIDAQGNINFDNITYFDIVRKYYYVYLSTSIGKTILKLSKKNYLLSSVGFRLNYLHRSVLFSERLPDHEKFNFISTGSDIEQNFTISIVASIGITHKFSDKFSIIIAPQFAYELSKIALKNTLGNEEVRFMNGSVNLGVLYNF